MKDHIQVQYRTELVGKKDLKNKYYAEVTHTGLNDYRIFSSDNKSVLETKINIHVSKLQDKWKRIVNKENVYQTKEASLREAQTRTEEAIDALKSVEDILLNTLDVDDTIDWEQLKEKSKFIIPNPQKNLEAKIASINKPVKANIGSHPNAPQLDDYKPHFSFLETIIKSKKEKKEQHYKNLFNEATKEWENKCRIVDDENLKKDKEYESQLSEYHYKISIIKDETDREIDTWQRAKADFYNEQIKKNEQVEVLKDTYMTCEQTAVLEYCELVLNKSEYPDSFPKNFELDYNADTKILVVEYSLPSIDQLPTLNEVKFIKNELKEYFISDSQVQKLFDATMYRITLRTIHELFEADAANAIEAVSFNGWVNSINKATGKRENNCILSVQVKKTEFTEIDLRHVDPKTCFKNLKGVGSSKLSGLTPIQPILQINRTDRRFVNHYDVADSLDDSTNLAAIDWEDFEHLIREVFAKEFNANGGEVKVTQASRDGGVDAIAFDPDPIRGGKIVIQAKRYTNTVGVSAVRDLYGTVMNEGATKGILVTTADYGPDAYDFAKGKPLTLMNGSNLLYLLEKHGHHVRIDLKEAKAQMK